METGITHLVLRRFGELPEVIDKVKDAGYDGMEVLLTDDGDITADSSEADLAKVRKLFDDRGMTMQGMCLSVKDRGSLVTGNPADADRFRDCVQAGVRACRQLGIDTVLIIPGGVTADIPYDVCYQRAREGVETLKPIADQGVNLAIEYVWNNFFLSPLELRGFLDDVDHPHIGFYMDTGNMMAFGFAEQWIRIVGPHVKKVHTKNYKRKPVWEWPSLLSDGDADWDAIMAALRDIGYNGPLISEMSGTWDQHAENAAFTKKLYAG